jgi:ribosomal protein L37AE/L43A
MYDPYLSELMRKYRFSIVSMRGLQDGLSPWNQGRPTQFNASGRWREVSLRIRRDIQCEVCGHNFTTAFSAVMDSVVEKGVSTLDTGRMVAVLERELRRRISCPRCGNMQRQVRQKIIQRNNRHGIIGIGTISANVLTAIALSMFGYALAGMWGLIIGFGVAIALVLKLTRWMLGKLLEYDL